MIQRKKTDAEFLYRVSRYFIKNELFATGTTGRLIEEVANLNVHKYLAGHLAAHSSWRTDRTQ